jgi:hypothetical protein
VCWPLAGLLHQSQRKHDCEANSGMRIWSTQRKPVPLPLPPQIPHDLTWDQTPAAEVESQQLTSWAMALPLHVVKAGVLCTLSVRISLAPCFMQKELLLIDTIGRYYSRFSGDRQTKKNSVDISNMIPQLCMLAFNSNLEQCSMISKSWFMDTLFSRYYSVLFLLVGYVKREVHETNSPPHIHT